jgi:ParB-like chromosome segregation protein Spo0J
MANPQFVDDAEAPPRAKGVPEFVDDAESPAPKPRNPFQPSLGGQHVVPDIMRQNQPAKPQPKQKPTPFDLNQGADLGAPEVKPPASAYAKEGDARDLLRAPVSAAQSIIHGTAETVGNAGKIMARVSKDHPEFARLVSHSFPGLALGTTAAEKVVPLKEMSEDVVNYNRKWRQQEDDILKSKLGVSKDTPLGQGASALGDIGSGVLKATALGPAALPYFAAEGGIDKTAQALDENKPLGKALAAGGVSTLTAATLMHLSGGNGEKAYDSLVKMALAKVANGTKMGLGFGAADLAVDKYILDKDMRPEEVGSSLLNSVKTMLGYELAGFIPEAKLAVRGKRIASEYASPEDAHADIAPKLADVYAKGNKSLVNDLFTRMQAVAYAEKANTPFTGKKAVTGAENVKDALKVVDAAKTPKQEVQDALQEQGPATTVPREGSEGGNLPEGREGMGQGQQGEETPRKEETSQKEEKVAKTPVKIVDQTSYKGVRQGSLMGPDDEMMVAKDAKGNDIGKLWVTKKPDGFEVRKVEVDPKNRRQGVAEQLYVEAHSRYGPYRGSTDQTPDGKAMNARLRETHPEIFEQAEKELIDLDSLKKRGGTYMVPPEKMTLDPDRLQFRDTKEPDPTLAKKSGDYLGWVDEDGKLVVVDGHHSLPGAIEAGKDIPVKVIEAKDSQTARAIGALKNIAEGDASGRDAKRLFKETGITPEEVKAAGITIEPPKMAAKDEVPLPKGPLYRPLDDAERKDVLARVKDALPKPAKEATQALEGEEKEPGGKFKANQKVAYTEQGKAKVGTVKREIAPGVYEVETSTGTTRKLIERAIHAANEAPKGIKEELAKEPDNVTKPKPKVDQETTSKRKELVKAIEKDPMVRTKMYRINGILNGDVDPTEEQIKAAQKQARREMIRTTADLFGGQQAYEKLMAKLGLEPDATIGEIADFVRGKIGKMGSSSKETALKIYSKFDGFGKKASSEIANVLHEADAPDFIQHPGKMLEDANRRIRGLVAPSTVSKDTFRMNDIMREHQARRAVGISEIGNSIHKALSRLDSLGRKMQDLVTDAVEDPNKLARIKDPELRKFAETIGIVTDGLWTEIKNRGGEEGYIQNYLHMAYKNPESAKTRISEHVASLHGNLGYMMTRRGPKTHALARELGLEFQENNPARILLADAANKLKFVFAHDAIQDAVNEGLIFEDKPKVGGYVELDPRVLRAYVGKGNFYHLSDKAVKDLTGSEKKPVKGDGGTHFYADPDVARIITNALQPGFQGNPFYELPKFLNNTMNQVELGLSPFHALVISNEIGASMAGIGFRDIAHGNIIKGIKNITTGLTPVLAQAQVYRQGTALRDMLDNNKPIPEELGGEKFREYFLAAGGRTKQSAEYVNNTIDQMRQSWGKLRDRDVSSAMKTYLGVKTIKDVPFAAIEAAMKPIMEHYVPAAKLGIFHAMYMQERPYIPDNAKAADIARNAARNWDQVENTMGQLTYENLAWNSRFKQIMMLGLRSVGWKLGSKRAIYGAAVDLAKAVPMTAKEISRGLHLTKPTEAQLAKEVEEAQARGDFAPHAQFTQRLGWALGQAAITVSTATALGTVNWLYHGRKKEDVPGQAGAKDFIYPRMGDSSDANANRINTPSYVKEAYDDYLSWNGLLAHGQGGGFADELSSAASPLYHEAQEFRTGKDYAGDTIDSQAKNAASKFLPITATSGLKVLKEGGTWGQAVAESAKSGFVQKPKSSHLLTEGQNEILRRYGKVKLPQGQDLAEQKAETRDIKKRMDNGEDVNEDALDDLSPAARKAMRGNGIGEATYSLIGKLPYKDAVDIYQNYLKPEEKVKAFPAIAKGIRKAMMQTRVSERDKLKDEFDKMRDEYDNLKDAP